MVKIAMQQDRLVSLDYLRGYFVIVIIIDHLSRFPSAWQLITGKGLLWATAAEGFVIISGLMLGYVRGFKDLNKSFVSVASKLAKRALLLYAWVVLGSVLYIGIAWKLSGIRAMPWYDAPVGDWATVLQQLITMKLPHVWVHFLYLYAIFLLLSIPAIWLLRKRQPWIVACLSFVCYIYGFTANSEWMRVQLIFFIPMIIGYYLPTIKNWWAENRHKTTLTAMVYSSALITLIASVILVTNEKLIIGAASINALFDIATFGLPRVVLAAIWFTALVFLFQKITPWLQTHTYGVVHYLGTHSLTAYVAHGTTLLVLSLLIPNKGGFVACTITGLIAILGTYALIRLPIIRRILPR